MGWWMKSMQEGLAKTSNQRLPIEQFELVYWADLLYKYNTHRDSNFIFDALYNHQPYVPAGRPVKLRKRDRFSKKLKGILADWLGDGLNLMSDSDQLVKLADWAVGKMARDLDYYDDPSIKIRNRAGTEKWAVSEVLRQELKTVLQATADRKVMVVSHSMGAIIAVDVLYALEREVPDLKVHTLVTLGAPLGFPHVRKRIEEEWERDVLRVPSNISHRWYNGFDPADPIAMDTELADCFLTNKQGIAVHDFRLLNDYFAPDSTPNPHKSYGYLRSPEMAGLLTDFLKG